MKKIITLFLAFLLTFNSVVSTKAVFADEEDADAVSSETAETSETDEKETKEAAESLEPSAETEDIQEETIYGESSIIYINPEYEDFFDENSLFSDEITPMDQAEASDPNAVSNNVFTSIDEASAFVAEAMMAHQSSATLKYTETSNSVEFDNTILNQILDAANKMVDDYTAHSIMGTEMGFSAGASYVSSGVYSLQYTITCTFSFSTTLEQEKEFNIKLGEVLNSLNLYNSSDFDKIKGVYDYITDNVVYDDEAILPSHDKNDKTPWSAWKALVKGTSVCQGYSLLTYKMLNSLGVEVYYAHGTANGGGPGPGAHAWNVVKLKGNYYLLDSTWDASYKKVYPDQYKYFLKGTEAFYTDHSPEEDDRYVVSASDYDMSSTPDPTVTVTGVSLAPAEKTVLIGETVQLVPMITPENATNKKVTYTSNNTAVATVDATGLVSAVKEGTATITVKTDDGNKTAAFVITVEKEEDPIIPVSKITAEKTQYTVDIADTTQTKINVVIEPANATIKDLVFVSNDESVARVDNNGTITPVGVGTAKITIYPVSNGYSEDDQATKINVNVTVTDGNYYTVILHGNGGTIKNGDVSYDDYTFKVSKKADYSEHTDFEIIPQNESQGFVGWYLDEDLSRQYSNDSVFYHSTIRNDLELYAKYSDKITVTLDFNGGYYLQYDGQKLSTMSLNGFAGERLDYYPPIEEIKNDDGMALSYWEKADGTIYKDLNNIKVDADCTLTAIWSQPYIITLVCDENGYYDYGDGYIREKTIKVAKGNSVNTSYSPSLLDPDHYFFDSYYLDSTYKNGITSLYSYVPNGDITLYARIGRQYDLTMNANGGSFEDGSNSATIKARDDRYLNSMSLRYPERGDGYAFVGWAEDAQGTKMIDPRNKKIDSDTTIYAIWQKGITITLHAGEGRFIDGKQDKVFKIPSGSTINNSYGYNNLNVTKDHGEFVGWYSDPSFDPSTIQSLDSGIISKIFTSSLDLYAKYEDTCVYTFHANGGTFSSWSQQSTTTRTYRKNELIAYPQNISVPTREKFVFDGWYEDEDCLGDKVTFVDKLVTEDKTFYAKWTDEYFTLKIHGNGGTYSGGAKDISFKYKANDLVSFTYSVNSFTRPNYLPVGYYYDPECTQKATDLRAFRITSDVDVYVKWTDQINKVTFDLSDCIGSGSWSSDDIAVIKGRPLSTCNNFNGYLNVHSADAKAFAGWVSNIDGYIGPDDGALRNYVPSGNAIISPKWTNDFYTLRLHAGEGTYRDPVSESYISDGRQLVAKGFKAEGVYPSITVGSVSSRYCIGWYSDQALTKLVTEDLSTFVPAKDMDLYAKYEGEQRATVTIDFNGGYSLDYLGRKSYANVKCTVNSPGMRISSYLSTYDNKTVFWKDNSKVFKGFSKQPNGELVNENELVSSDLILYAVYSDDFYTVKLDYNGGSYLGRSADTYRVFKGQYIQLNSLGQRDDGSNLKGYSKNKDGSGELLQGSFVPDSDVTLYAIWSDRYYSLEYVVEDGYMPSNYYYSANRILEGQTVYLDGVKPISNQGKTFVGWYDNPEFTGSAYGYSFKMDRDITLYAKFADQYTVTFDANGRSFADGSSIKTIKVDPGKSLYDVVDQIPKAPASGQYTFTNWNTKKDGSGDLFPYNSQMKITSDMCLYAQWNITPVAVNSVSISSPVNRIKVGNSVTLSASILPENATYKDLFWISSNSSIASIDQNGVLKAIKAGKVTVSVTASGDKKDTIEIEVYEREISLKENLRLYVNEKIKMIAQIMPDGDPDASFVWSVNDSNIASIDQDGTIFGRNAGTVKVTVKTADGTLSKTVDVVVIDPDTAGTQLYMYSLYFAGTDYELEDQAVQIGQTVKLEARNSAGHIDNARLIWTSADNQIAVIDNEGNLTALKEGEVRISAADRNSKTIESRWLTVVADERIDVADLSSVDTELYPSDKSILKLNETRRYAYRFEPANADAEFAKVNITNNDGMNVKVSYDDRVVDGKKYHVVYFDVTSSSLGSHTLRFTYGKNNAKSESLRLETLSDNDIYDVTFDARGGVVINPYYSQLDESNAKETVTLHYRKNAEVSIMKARHPGDYGFVGWYTDLNKESSKIETDFYELDRNYFVISSDITLYAKWDDVYVSTFVANGGEIYQDGKSYDTLTMKTIKGRNFYYAEEGKGPEKSILLRPNRSGYVFSGWYLDEKCTEYYAGGKAQYHPNEYKYFGDMIPAGNKTYYAGWEKSYVLKLVLNGGKYENEAGVHNIQVTHFDVTNLYDFVPTYEGMIFAGWYYDKALTRKVEDPETLVINNDTTLYAKYIDEYYTVTFDLGEGTAYIDEDNKGSKVTMQVAKGSPVGAFPTVVYFTAEDKAFSGKWYSDSARTKEVDLASYVPTNDVTLYAGFNQMITVKFDLNGGYFMAGSNKHTTYDYYMVSGSKLSFPYEAQNDNGVVFAGWYKEKTYSNKVNLDSFRPTAGMTLYAKWEASKVKVTLDANGGSFENGSSSKQIDVAKNSKFAELSTPIADEQNRQLVNYWAFDAEGENKVGDDYEFTSDITLYAVWKAEVRAVGVEIIDPPASVSVIETFQFIAEVAPIDALNQDVIWSVSDSDLALITTSGLFTPKKKGTVTVTATTVDGGHSDSVVVMITGVRTAVTSLKPQKTNVELNIGDTFVNTVTVLPENATDKSLIWISKDPEIASVDDEGRITAISEGETTITVKSEIDEISVQFTVSVNDPYINIEKLQFTQKEISLTKGGTKKLEYALSPENAVNKNVTWSSSDPDIAKVDQNGNVTAVAVGSAYIFAIAKGSDAMVYPLVGDYCIVNVTDEEVKVSEISINTAKKEMFIGDEDILTATVLPDNATNKNVIWKTSNESVLVVDQTGKIKAVSVGMAVITVSSEDGQVSDECTVTVKEHKVLAESIKLSEQELRIQVSTSKQLSATIAPNDVSETKVKWSSSDEKVVTVDQNGKISGLSIGSATVTVSTIDGSELSASCTVIVEKGEEDINISFDKNELELRVGEIGKITATIKPEKYAEKGIEYAISNNDGNIEFDEKTGTIKAIKATGDSQVTIQAKVKGYDTSGLEDRYSAANEALKTAKNAVASAKKVLDQRETAKTAAQEDYSNKQKATALAKEDVSIAADQLKQASAEKSAAEKDVEAKKEALSAAKAELEQTKASSGDTASLIENAKKAKEDAEIRYQTAQNQIKKGTVGFFESNGSEVAVQLVNERVENQKSDNVWGKTEIGKKGDATSLDNMKESIRLVQEGNDLRDQDDVNTDLKPLIISDSLMAIAEIQANASDFNTRHSMMFYVGENLSWGFKDPYYGWYYAEKLVYDYCAANNVSVSEAAKVLLEEGKLPPYLSVNSVGHYLNLIREGTDCTGFATVKKGGNRYGVTHGQVFSYSTDDEKYYTVAEYEKLFNQYYDDVYKELADSKKALENATKDLENIQKNGGLSDAAKAMISNAENKVKEAEKALEDAQKALDEATNKESEKATALSNVKKILETKQKEEEASLQNKDTAIAQYNIALKNYNDAKVAEAKAQQNYDQAKKDMEGLIAFCEVKVIQTITSIDFVDTKGQKIEKLQLEKGYTYYLKKDLVIEPKDITSDIVLWASDNESVATVDKDGIITGVNTGTVVISAYSRDNSGVRASVTVRVIPAGVYGEILPEDRPADPDNIPEGIWTSALHSFNYDPSIKSYVFDNDEPRVYYGNKLLNIDIDYTIKYANNTKAGLKSDVKPPMITVTGKGNYSGSLSQPFDILPMPVTMKVDLTDTYAYNKSGSSVSPKLTYNNKKLSNKKDYTFYILNSQGVRVSKMSDPGVYTVVIDGAGNYSFHEEYQVKVIRANQKLVSKLNVTLPSAKAFSYEYDGSEKKPEVTIKDGKAVLEIGKYFDVSYENNIDAGTATVLIKAKDYNENPYCGSATKTFKINGVALSKASFSKLNPASYVYTGEEICPKQTVTIKVNKVDHALKEGEDYIVEYIDNVAVGTATIVYNGKGQYSGSVKKTFKIIGQPINKAAVSGLSSVTYTGKSIKLGNLKVSYNGKELVEGEDYTITYKNNRKAGKATITIKGLGGYTGSVNKTFTITKAAIGKDDVALKQTSIGYTKGGARPEITVTVNKRKLVQNVDYTVSYKNNTKLGKATLIVKGKGNYQGTVEKTFEVSAKPLSDVALNLSDKAYTGKANTWKASVVLMDANGKKLAANTDYNAKTVTYKYAYIPSDKEIKNGTGKNITTVTRKVGDEVEKNDILPVDTKIEVVVSTQGAKGANYTGTVTGIYRIVKADISKASITVPVQYYTGNPVKLDKAEVRVILNKNRLNEEDFEIISYLNNTAKGTAKVTIRGVDNYGGIKTVNFSIKQRPFGNVIHFDGNGATSGKMNDQVIYKNTALSKGSFKKVVTLNGATKTYTFKGWKDDKGNFYPDKAMMNYSIFKAGSVTVLHAVWE